MGKSLIEYEKKMTTNIIETRFKPWCIRRKERIETKHTKLMYLFGTTRMERKLREIPHIACSRSQSLRFIVEPLSR